MSPRPNNYAFIDNQNLFRAIANQGWSLDLQKFRRFLANRLYVRRAYLFLGYIPQNQPLYDMMKQAGYKLIFKPVIYDQIGLIKGNVDAELVLQTMSTMRKYDKAVIVSGDGDFHCLVKHLVRRDKIKQLIIPDKYRYSRLLKASFTGQTSITFMNELKTELQRVK